MDIELTVRSLKGPVSGWRHHVLGSGTPTVAGGAVETIKVPDKVDATLRILPSAPQGTSPAWKDDPTAYWPLDLSITWKDGVANVDDPYHQVDVSRGSNGALRLSVVLSRVRDASHMLRASTLQTNWPMDREKTGSFSYARRNGPRSAGPQSTDLIDAGGKIVRVSPLDTISSGDDFMLFEIAPPRRMVNKQEKLSLDFRPKLVAAYVGTAVTKGNFLVYYYPQMDQDPTFLDEKKVNNLRRDSDDPDDARLGVDHYPNAFQHLDRVVFGKLFYGQDPWFARRLFQAGLAHQVAASARTVGVVIPIPDLDPTIFGDGGQTSLALGVAVFPEDLHEIVREIWAHVQSHRLRSRFRSSVAEALRVGAKAAVKVKEPSKGDLASALEAGIIKALSRISTDSAARPPVADLRKDTSIDRAMVAAFSNGNHYLNQLAKRLAALPSPTSLPFREFCSLDSPGLYSGVERTVRAACDKLPDSRVYYYWKYSYDVVTRENGKPRTLKGAGVYQTALEGRFFYSHLPKDAWPAPVQNDLDIHAWIDATMVCDALKCSTFPVNGAKAVP